MNKLLIVPRLEAVRLTEYEVYGGGAVELYDNLGDLWVSACARDWDKEDADVICRQLGFLDGAAHGLFFCQIFCLKLFKFLWMGFFYYSSCGKVMFSQASVSHSVDEGR